MRISRIGSSTRSWCGSKGPVAETHAVTGEGQHIDKKSLRIVQGAAADWQGLAKDCVAFSNASGGRIRIGIEDDADEPPSGQRIAADTAERVRRRIAELTVNVTTVADVIVSPGGGEYLDLTIPRGTSVASTTGGEYYLRVADQSRPVVGDDVLRLAAERGAWPWETQTTQRVPRTAADTALRERLLAALRASERVKAAVKEKSDEELLEHYQLVRAEWLTNLGILCIGRRQERADLLSSPVIQCIRYDDRGEKIAKRVWDDHDCSPMDLVEAVWREVPEFREQYELPYGLYRQQVPAFDEVVVRELLVNALVHRPYTQRGDIFLNLHPDRLEVVNPGPLPLGVTPRNVLHTTVRRNEHLARLFHDLKLMEREGTGFDRMFEVLLSQGRPGPEIAERDDRVQVIVRRRILKPAIIDLMAKADQVYQLTQRERIALGLLAQHDAMTVEELAAALELGSAQDVQPWIRRLQQWGLVHSAGRTRATRYFVNPKVLRDLEFTGSTTLKRIEPHRLAALVLEDLRRYPGSAISAIRGRVGAEIEQRQVKRALDALHAGGAVRYVGEKRWRRYWPVS